MGKKLSKSNVLWYIRSRPYTSLPDLRRRFEIDGDEMSVVEGPEGKVWLGLPEKAANILGQLWREGKIGLECAIHVKAPVVDGVYPMHLRSMPGQPSGREGGETAEGDLEAAEESADSEAQL